jgi:hypothetical protein
MNHDLTAAIPSLPSAGEFALVPSRHLHQTDAEHSTDGIDFDQVEPPLSGLVLAHEGLVLAESRRKFDLGEALALSNRTKDPDQHALFSAVDGPTHPPSRRCHDGISQNGILGGWSPQGGLEVQ